MDTQKIDWTQPLEAVHTDGRVVPVKLDPEYAAPGIGGNYTLDEEPAADSWYTWTADGKSWMDDDHEWTIRNLAPKEAEWGPEIKVEGKRPAWLDDDDLRIDVRWGSVSYVETENDTGAPVRCVYWNGATAIRLPANHHHYATPTRTALEQRMEDLIRRMVRHETQHWSGDYAEARAIVAELPDPVDGDLLEARRVANSTFGDKVHPDFTEGKNDGDMAVRIAWEAIQRGRALERGESPVTNEGAGR